jgi:Ni,Fe-hydrogenase maturation factor
MRALLIAIGNPLRSSDGIACAAAGYLSGYPRIDVLTVLQLTPEIAAEIASYDLAIFIDADIAASEIAIEPMRDGSAAASPLTHMATPEQAIALARKLFRFAGEALVCRIPATSLSVGAELSPRDRDLAARAAAQLSSLLTTRTAASRSLSESEDALRL